MLFERRAEKSRGALIRGIIGREAESSAQLSFSDDEETGTVGGIDVDKIGAGDNKSEGVGVGRRVEDMDGLVCKPTSEVRGSGKSTAAGVKKVSSSGGKSTWMLASI